MKNLVVLPIVALFALFSCQKEIKINLNEANPKLVIEANYIATDSLVTVRISYTGNYFDEYSSNLVNDAAVFIKETNGSYTTVPSVGNGKYELANYAPTYGATYTIQVVKDGIAYESSSLLMPTMDFLPAAYEYQEETLFSEAGYRVKYSFQDPPGIGNCYKVIETYRDTTFSKFGEFRFGDDRLTDGNIHELSIFKSFLIGDTVLIELQSINQAVHNYYDQLSTNTSAFTAAQGNPDYYWTNEALGYFSAYGYKRQQVVIQ
ncbi:MAG: DUF4249 domain-containing protein [Crocinitomicaceae bacterium]|nr:DUF4249 domain-containing protein [Crocinitomicaceae bacterium]